MFQVRIHGRGGQGVVTAAELLSIAAFGEGRHAQAFPSFGSERMGAPVIAFCRIDDREIRLREPIADPDAVIVQDPTLLHQVDLFSGLRTGGYVLINSGRSFEELGIGDLALRFPPAHLRCVPASEIAQAHVGRPLPNAALLGGFAGLTGAVSLEAVVAAIEERFAGAVGAANAAAAREAYAHLHAGQSEEAVHA
jgi:pyruvate ferredoxin oxidoreductase gamma subunit